MKPAETACDYVIEDSPDQPATHPHTIAWAQRLGYAGLLPFAGALVLLFAGNQAVAELALNSLLAYAAVILTFVGALHWSSALLGRNDTSSVSLLVISVLPSLVAWLCLLIPVAEGLLLMALAYLAVYSFDRSAWRDLQWFVRLRTHLTIGALSCLLSGWLRVTL